MAVKIVWRCAAKGERVGGTSQKEEKDAKKQQRRNLEELDYICRPQSHGSPSWSDAGSGMTLQLCENQCQRRTTGVRGLLWAA